MPSVSELLERESTTVDLEPGDFERLVRRRDRKRRNKRIGAVTLAIILALVSFAALTRAFGPAERPADEPAPTPTPTESILRRNGEVITIEAGRLVAVDPDTGESRIIVDVEQTYPGRRIGNAAWSPDGRWVAYDLSGGGLWVVNAERETRQLAAEASYGSWTWSPTAPQLAMVRDSRLTVVDASTGRQTDLGDVVGERPRVVSGRDADPVRGTRGLALFGRRRERGPLLARAFAGREPRLDG